MKVEIWSDYVCPFCYIGKRTFETALEQFADKEKVTVVLRSFELDPKAEKFPKEDTFSMIAHKYQLSYEQSKQMHERLALQAKQIGLNYHFDRMVITNTFDAHRLTKYAETKGQKVAQALAETIFEASFTNGQNISEHEVLTQLAVAAKLPVDKVQELLETQNFAQEVRSDELLASELAIQGVPFFLINGEHAISGAQSAEAILEVLRKSSDNQ